MEMICLTADLRQWKAALGAIVAWRDGGTIDSQQKQGVMCGKQINA